MDLDGAVMNEDISVSFYNNCHFQRLVRNNSHFGYSLGGYDSNRNLIQNSLMKRHYLTCDVTDLEENPNIFIQYDCIYGGVLINHFGHFILESLSRLWICRHLKINFPICWYTLGQEKVLDWQKNFFSLLNIDYSRFIFINQATRFNRLLLPSQGYVMDNFVSSYFLDSMQIEINNDFDSSRKIWISRSKLPRELGGIDNENLIEDFLINSGWEIIIPESLSIHEQLLCYNSAGVIAGFEGSAFHMLMFLPQIRAKILLFGRRKEFVHGNYLTIAKAKNLNQSNFILDMEFVEGQEPASRWRICNLDQFIKIINDNVV